MAKIAVFDSGLGSLSVIKPIQKRFKLEIIYFADQDSFPYGTKSTGELKKIIKLTIKKLKEKFEPDLIVVASNTPSLLLNPEKQKGVLGIYPPLKVAAKKTRTKTMAVLATRSVVKSKELQNYIKEQVPTGIEVIKIDASPLVDLVESGKFISKKEFCKKQIREILQPIQKENADVATLSSTHLPFLLPMLKQVFPNVTFIDPANCLADKVSLLLKNKKSDTCKLKIFASGDIKVFQEKLQKIGIKNKVLKL
ncbi:MAG TPA: aspartate/glutamate racemase family protein [Candidatus Nitrosotalea sp.]|nr:aspartate/glutamate racemase family protein [Candidatus Nitrosotalea sp.]